MKTKKLSTLLLCLALTLSSITSLAAASKITKNQPYLDDVEFKYLDNGTGYVDIGVESGYFTNNCKVKVTDSSGKTYTSKFMLEWDDDNDDDEGIIKVSGIKRDTVYSFSISGVYRNGKTYTLKSSFKANSGLETNYRDGKYRYTYDD